MYKVRKKNRVLQIADEKVDEYKQMGYAILDEDDKVIWEPEEPKKKVAELLQENEALKAKVAELEAKKTTSRTSKKAEQEA